MSPKPIHDPARGPMRVAALMSGSGTNVRRILELGEQIIRREGQPIFQVAVIFSDRFDSKAGEIGRDYEIPVLTHDLGGWLTKHRVTRRDLARREDFDRENVELIKPFNAGIAVYGGYMSIASPTLVRAFIGINVHPADLSVIRADGKRRWRGAHAVRDAIAAGERFIHSSTHLVTEEVDSGPIFMISAPLEVEVPDNLELSDPELVKEVADLNQERLKQAGDWVIFPRTIEAVARGFFEIDEKGGLYYQGEPTPSGLRLSD